MEPEQPSAAYPLVGWFSLIPRPHPWDGGPLIRTDEGAEMAAGPATVKRRGFLTWVEGWDGYALSGDPAGGDLRGI